MRNIILIFLLFGFFGCSESRNDILNPPVSAGSMSSSLVATDYGIVLSWMEPQEGDIHLKNSIFNGRDWSEPKTIAKGTNWFVNWADFPVIISNGEKLFTHYLQMVGTNTYDYDIMYRFSDDKGNNWSDPIKLHNDTVKGEHGFVSGIPYKDGFAVAWLDGRYTKSAKPVMSLRGAIISKDGIVENSHELDSMTCDCCNTAVAEINSEPVVFYRDRTEGEVRDISVVSFSEKGPKESTFFSEDKWVINACPVNGPAVASDKDIVAVAWYTGAESEYKVKLKISNDAGQTYGQAILVDGPESFGRVGVQIYEGNILITYLTRKDNTGAIMLAEYTTAGDLISKMPLVTASPDRGTGFPKAVIWKNSLVLTWTDADKGIVKVLAYPLDKESMRAAPRR